MANILILGDTWGITPCHNFGTDSSVANWFEFHFLKHGHATFNKAFGGHSNTFSFEQADVFLNAVKETNFQIDLVIWFHTELIRDVIPEDRTAFAKKHYDFVVDEIAGRMYTNAKRIKNLSPTTKWVIIGGHAPLRPNKKHLLDWADYRIDNFREKIIGAPVPESQAFEYLEQGKGSLWDFPGISDSIIERELAIKEQIISLTKDKDKFYNGKHPALKPMINLANEIMEYFKL